MAQYIRQLGRTIPHWACTGVSGGWGESSLQEFDHNHETKNQVFMQINDFWCSNRAPTCHQRPFYCFEDVNFPQKTHFSPLKPYKLSNFRQAITSARFHIAQVIQLFSCWRSRRILQRNSYSCLSLLLVSHKKCRINLIGPWHFGAFLRDQSDSSYIA